ncbi:MAG: hypothetical protein A3D56_01365 [Candidatus Taylorbacteria bacterium RIFCSPHIGHO2_02_FULL_45_35]|uniref:Uncharacterized protein n=1 Tax=Candidatus Taylorbacteria bacterium RIFCSPHIGHO2_02_FULL_45_35 TaxID=1802311 RepID=A0A1G2MVF9_9BACT|nr:MAG: hypothetical protein A3D56_01365 [Candidatus Taylorbacteria bacterium RIFCSPHIGHO2_02_FULL_45_35]
MGHKQNFYSQEEVAGEVRSKLNSYLTRHSFCVREVEDTYVEVPNSHFPLSASEAERGTLFRSKTELRGREPC